MTRCDQTIAWNKLTQHYTSTGQHFDLRQAFAQDATRFKKFSQSAPQMLCDLSKNQIDSATEALLFELATECGIEQKRDAMLRGEPINSTEARAVLHTLLRADKNTVFTENTGNVTVVSSNNATDNIVDTDPYGMAGKLQSVHATLDAMLAYASRIRADSAITDVVNIGIGGSDLGPQMAVLALDGFVDKSKRFHFVSNVDGHELAATLARCQPHSTLFIVASKTFTTIETMTNAQSAKAWFEAQGGVDTARHFCALTTNVAAAKAFGIDTTFGFWDWVGGRYSVWSAIGLPIAIAIGAEGFQAFLKGARDMDAHFSSAPMAQNLPMRLGLLDVWYRNFHRFSSRCVAPYHAALKRLPAYLQQLEMESNGKRVDASGQALPYATSPVIWGEPGTNGQHAFFQLLHQGSDVIPMEFIAVKHATHSLLGHHALLLANALAQAQAFMLGKSDEGGHGHFPGNRPSSFIVLEQLSPQSLGALIALYEHRVFVSGAVWGINSFDQYGVELGKVLARDIATRMASGDLAGLDGSTAGLMAALAG